MTQEFAIKLRLTAALLGCGTHKDLCARFRAVNPSTGFDLTRSEKWLQGRAIGLEQRRPMDVLATPAGARLVEEFLGRIEYGVYTSRRCRSATPGWWGPLLPSPAEAGLTEGADGGRDRRDILASIGADGGPSTSVVIWSSGMPRSTRVSRIVEARRWARLRSTSPGAVHSARVTTDMRGMQSYRCNPSIQ